MGWLSPGEMMIILVIVLLLFGGRKIPELMRSLGSGLSQFKKGIRDGEAEVKKEIDKA